MCGVLWGRAGLEKLQKEAEEAAQQLAAAVAEEQEAAAALEEGEKQLRKLKSEEEKWKEAEEKDVQDAQARHYRDSNKLSVLCAC